MKVFSLPVPIGRMVWFSWRFFFLTWVRCLILRDEVSSIQRTKSSIRHFLMLYASSKCLSTVNQIHTLVENRRDWAVSFEREKNLELIRKCNISCVYSSTKRIFFVFISDSGLPPFGRGDDSGMGDDRIAHILSEASGMMKPSLGNSQSQPPMSLSHHHQNDDSRSNDDSDSLHNQSLSPFSKDSRRARKYDNDDISREKMARIYQEELAKLMTRDAFPK